MYSCALCGMAVVVIEGAPPIRACDHTVPIIASAEATLAGRGGMNDGDV